MGGAGEEVEGLGAVNFILREKKLDVAGLGGGVAGEVDDFGGVNL